MNPAKGWYDDPTSPGRLRWWDGERWTELTRALTAEDGPATEVADAAPTPASAPAPEPQTRDAAPQDSAAPSLFGKKPPEILRPPEQEKLVESLEAERERFSGRGSVQDAPPLPPLPEGGERLVTIDGGADSQRGRRAAIFATIALAVIVGVIATVALSGFGTGNVFDLEPGACFDDDEDASQEVRSVSTVPEVDCEEAHDNEVYAVFDVGMPSFPGGATLGQLAVDGCVDRFADAVGFPMDLTDLDASAFWPTQTTWDQGDREVVCFLFRLDRAKLVGSRLDLAAGTDRGVFQLRQGDCFNAPLRDAEAGAEVEGVAVLDCALPHFAEVYASFGLPAQAYPGFDELATLAQERCLEAFEPFVGQPFEDSVLWFNALPPTRDSWDAGDRDVLCYVYDLVNGDMTGGARAWALAHRDDLPEFGDGIDVSFLDVGDCFDDPINDAVQAVPCNENHDNEVFFVDALPGTTWPGEDALTIWIRDRCDPAFEEWVGPDRNDLTWFSFQPTPTTWDRGDRRIVCALYDVDFLPMGESQQRQTA